MANSVEDGALTLKGTTFMAREQAERLGNRLVSKPHLMGHGNSVADDDTFQVLLLARADLRAALAAVDDAVASVKQWRVS